MDEKARQLPQVQQELQEVQCQVQQLEATVLQLSALKARVAELQAEAAECELLNEQHEQLQGVSLEAEQLRQQVQELRQSATDLPALREELQELQALLMARQQLQQEAQDAEQIRQQVQQLREGRVDLSALREELQQLQAVHEEAQALVGALQEKVGGCRCCGRCCAAVPGLSACRWVQLGLASPASCWGVRLRFAVSCGLLLRVCFAAVAHQSLASTAHTSRPMWSPDGAELNTPAPAPSSAAADLLPTRCRRMPSAACRRSAPS